MLILAFDTTSEHGGVGIYRDMECLASVANEGGTNYSVNLFQMTDHMLRLAGISLRDIELFAVANGPGSFTGIRVGVAAAQAWAMAFERPVRGVSTLEAMVEQAEPHSKTAVPILDARRGEFYVGVFHREDGVRECSSTLPGQTAHRPREGEALFSYQPANQGLVLKPEGLVLFVQGLTRNERSPGSGEGTGLLTCIGREHDAAAQKLRDGLDVRDGFALPFSFSAGAQSAPLPVQWQSIQGPLVTGIARIALRAQHEGTLQSPAQLDAYYVRRSDAEMSWRE